MKSYSLWEEPFIPVLRSSGESDVLSIRETLAEAHKLREVFDSSPLIVVSIHRLLMALLYRIYMVKTTEDWVDIWLKGKFDQGKLDEYGKLWSSRFDVLDEEKPFYQVPFISDEKIHPITALIMEAASGNNPTLFHHGQPESEEGLSLDRAACHLLAHQLFALGGGVSKPFNRMDAPLAKGLLVEIVGQNLFETLCLNLIPINLWRDLVPSTKDDKPFWEMDYLPEPVKEGTPLLGPMHYLTWQSRKIHLCVDEESLTVTGCQIRQRYALPQGINRIDPGKVYKMSEKEGWVLQRADKQRAAWQYTNVLLQKIENSTTRPYVLEWIGQLQKKFEKRYQLCLPNTVNLQVTGLTTDPQKAAKIDLWRRERLPIPLALLEKPELVSQLSEMLHLARLCESYLNQVSLALAWALAERHSLPAALNYYRTGKLPPNVNLAGIKKLSQGFDMVTRFWPALEIHFRDAIEGLEKENQVFVKNRWIDAIQSEAEKSFQGVRNELVNTEASYEVLAKISDIFYARLNGNVKKWKEGIGDGGESYE